MAEGVVDLLEVVDVERDEAERGAGAAVATELEGEGLVEETPVGEAGELVSGGEPLDLVEEPDVAQRQRGVRDRLDERVDGETGDARARPATPFGGHDAERLVLAGQRRHDEVVRVGEPGGEQPAVERPDQARVAVGEHRVCRSVPSDPQSVPSASPHPETSQVSAPRTTTRTRANPSRSRRCRISASRTSSGRRARSSAPPRSTSAASSAPVWRRVRSLTDWNAAAPTAKRSSAAALTASVRLSPDRESLTTPADAAVRPRNSSSAQPHRDLQPGAVRGEEGHGHHLEEGQEDQRALGPAGQEDGSGEEHAVDEHQRGEQRGPQAREPSAGQLGAADHEEVRDRHRHRDAGRADQSREREDRDGETDPDQLQDAQAVVDRRLDVTQRGRRHSKSRKSRCASIGARAIRGSRRSTRPWTARKTRTAPTSVKSSP